jgi:hypothetical protein
MKITQLTAGILGLFALVGAESAHADILEFRCQETYGRTNGVDTQFEIFRSAPRSVQGDIRMQEYTPRRNLVSGFQVTGRRVAGVNQIRFDGAGINLNIDLGFDRIPRQGLSYRASVSYRSRMLNRNLRTSLDCQYYGF